MDRFNLLLDAYCDAETPPARAEAETALWTAYGVDATVMVIDMSGVSRLTLRHGIVHYLALVRRMQKVARPLIERFGGGVVKYEADNAYASFAEPAPAIRAGDLAEITFEPIEFSLAGLPLSAYRVRG